MSAVAAVAVALLMGVVVAGCSPAPTGSAGSPVGAVAVDATLLDLLPSEVADAARVVDATTAAEIAADPVLGADVEALAVALYASAQDYAVVTVTRFRPGVLTDEYYRDWRDSFDEGVCAQAGGVDGHAQAPIGSRLVNIGTCAGGVRTYHLRLAEPDRIISLQALGDLRYGELIMAGVTE